MADTETYWSAFASFLAAAACPSRPIRSVEIECRGASPWLAACARAAQSLPGVRLSSSAPIVITDGGGPGWFFALDGQRVSPDLPEFFWHALRGPHPIQLSLHSSDGVEGVLRIPPVPGFYWREQHAAAMDAAPALLLVALIRRLGGAVRPTAPAVTVLSPATAPSVPALTWFRFRKLLRSLYLRLPGASREWKWQIALHRDPPSSLADRGWSWTPGFPGHEAADPFLVAHQDRVWLFFEDMLPGSRRGRLAVMPAFEDAQPHVILDTPYHLSYPCVFRHDDEWWMLPESSENGTVDLYRARRFPFEWDHVRTLVSGPRFVDTTPRFHEGIWYFFTTAALPGRGYLSLLFTAEALDAPWRLHPASPLTGDAAIARGAGPIVVRDGKMLRPVQDCLFRYGYSVAFREIVRLSPDALEERPAGEILPDWSPGLGGTHTYSTCGRAVALDGLR